MDHDRLREWQFLPLDGKCVFRETMQRIVILKEVLVKKKVASYFDYYHSSQNRARMGHTF